ncbi:MAG: hypothetical protein WD037_03760 [Balneolales bacterium]
MKTTLSIILLLFGLMSCSDVSTDPELEEKEENTKGTVSFAITGDYEIEKNGNATFWGAGESSFNNDNGHSWQLLTSDEHYPDPGVLTFRLDFIFLYPDEDVSRPEPGEYPIGSSASAESPDSPVFSASYARVEDASGYFSHGAEMCGMEDEYSHTGTLTIETSTPELVSGSFDFEAYFCTNENTETVSITGEFTAPRADLTN